MFDDMDGFKLPCDVKVGRTTVRKGCGLDTLLLVLENHNKASDEKDQRLRDLMAENEKLKDECTDWLDDNARMSNEIAAMREELAGVRAENDGLRNATSCEGCKFVGVPSRDAPCSGCRRGYSIDRYASAALEGGPHAAE